jgi:hypothetical protein
MPQQKFTALSGFSRDNFAKEEIMTTDNGSDVLRALWQRESASSFSMEPDEIQRKLSRIQAELRDVPIMYVFCAGIAIWFAYFLVFTTQPIVTRAGLFLIVLGMGFWIGQIWLYNRDGRKALLNSVSAGKTNCVKFYRAELVRQRDFCRGGWLWWRTVAFYAGLFLGGWEPLHHWRGNGNAPRAVNLLIVSIVAIFTVWMSYRKSQKIQKNIDAIDAMNDGGEAGLL